MKQFVLLRDVPEDNNGLAQVVLRVIDDRDPTLQRDITNDEFEKLCGLLEESDSYHHVNDSIPFPPWDQDEDEAADEELLKEVMEDSTVEGTTAALEVIMEESPKDPPWQGSVLLEMQQLLIHAKAALEWYAAPHRPEDYLTDNGDKAEAALKRFEHFQL